MSHLADKTRDELREIAADLGLAVSGTKPALIDRIETALGDPSEPTQAPQDTPEPSEATPTPPEPLADSQTPRKPRGPGLRRNQTRRIRLGRR